MAPAPRRRVSNATRSVLALLFLVSCILSLRLSVAMDIPSRNSTSQYYVDDDDDEYARLMNDRQSWLSSNILGNICCLQTFGFETDSTTTVLEGSAFDIIVVESEDGKLFQNSDFLVSFKGENDKLDGHEDHHDENKATYKIVMEVNHHAETKAWFPILRQTAAARKHANNNLIPSHEVSSGIGGESDGINEDCIETSSSFDDERFWGCCHPSAGSAVPGTLSQFQNGESESNDDPSAALKAFLKPGKNPVRYLLLDDQRVVGVAHASIYLWKHTDSIVVSDIDGTITKSNARGVFGTIVTKQYDRVCHEGICSMLSGLAKLSKVVYVTSRPIALANQTREFLSTLKQEQDELPDGPLLGFGGRLPQLLLMELVSKTTQRFKAGKLWQQVIQPFQRANNNDSTSPMFVAGFGNNFMDMQSYHAIGMDLSRMFKINKRSQIVTFDKGNTTRTHGTTPTTQERRGEFVFAPHEWYKDRIGTKFDGYTDPKLIERLLS